MRNIIAGAVALYLALIFDLEQPQWALTTVFIVGQFTSGMVLGKGAYRLVGTLVGGVASVALIAVFGQSPLLFLLAMATWLALCTTSLLRSQGALALARDRYLCCLASAFKQSGPSEQSLTLMDAPSQALLGALEQPSKLVEQDMAKAAILQLQYTWRKACQPSTE